MALSAGRLAAERLLAGLEETSEYAGVAATMGVRGIDRRLMPGIASLNRMTVSASRVVASWLCAGSVVGSSFVGVRFGWSPIS